MPSTRIDTVPSRTLSVASAVTRTDPLSTSPSCGEEMLTAGGVLSVRQSSHSHHVRQKCSPPLAAGHDRLREGSPLRANMRETVYPSEIREQGEEAKGLWNLHAG